MSKPMNKNVRNGIIAAFIIVLLIAGIAVVSRIDVKEPEQNTETSDMYDVYPVSADELESVEVINAEGVITAVNNDGVWKIKDTADGETDSVKVYGLAGAVASLESKNKVEESTADLSVYGLDKPRVTVNITALDGKKDTLIIGDMSPTLGEYFVMRLGDDTVYTMYEFKVDTLEKPLEYYREFNRFSVNIDDITGIKITRSDETIEIKVLDNIDKDTNNVWEMTKPYKCGANDDYIDDKILEPIDDITLSIPAEEAAGTFSDAAVVELTVKPYDNITGEYGKEYTETLEIGAKNGDNTYVRYNNNVFLTKADSVSFARDSSFNIMSKLQTLVDISEVKSVIVEYNGASHIIGIDHGSDKMSFTLDSKETDSAVSQQIYKQLIALAVDGKYNGESMGNTVLKISYKGISGESDTEIEFKSINTLNCALVRNGSTNFTIKKSKLNEFIKLFEEYVKNVG